MAADLKDRVLRVLRGPVVRKIDFSFENPASSSAGRGAGFRINGSGFLRVADALQADDIVVLEKGEKVWVVEESPGRGLPRRVRVVRRREESRGCRVLEELEGRIPPGAGGVYNSLDNVMTFPSPTPEEEDIVHEAVHALLDIRKCLWTTRLSSEAAAFLAEEIYRRLKGWALESLGVLGEADRLAQKVGIYTRKSVPSDEPGSRGFKGGSRPGKPATDFKMGITLSWQDYQPLRRAVRNEPAYREIPWLAGALYAGVKRRGTNVRW